MMCAGKSGLQIPQSIPITGQFSQKGSGLSYCFHTSLYTCSPCRPDCNTLQPSKSVASSNCIKVIVTLQKCLSLQLGCTY